MAANGEALRSVSVARQQAYESDWSPDGREIAFVRANGGRAQLLVAAGGGEPRKLLDRPRGGQDSPPHGNRCRVRKLGAVKTEVTELPESRVKIEAAVDAAEVDRSVDRAAKSLANEMKLPGFRKGKVPPQLVVQRLGREAVVEQALRDSLPEWYERALLDAGVAAIGEPQLDVGDLPAAGADLAFTIEVGVRPTAELGDYKGLEVGKASVEVPDDAIAAELDRLREAMGSLAPVDRPAAAGDAIAIDFEGTIDGEPFEGSAAKDFVIELGSEGLLPEFDVALSGAAAGDEREVEVTFPDDHDPPSSPPRRRSSRSPSRRSARSACRSSTTTSPPRHPSSTRSMSCATTSASASRRVSNGGRRRSSARRRSTPLPPTQRSRSRMTSSTPARTRCGSGSSAS